MENRRDAGDVVLMGGHHRCHDDNIGDLTDFRRLNVDGQQGKVQPASVAGVVVRTEGNQHQQQNGVENHHGAPVLLQRFHIDGGNHGVHHNSQHDGRKLNQNITQVSLKLRRIGGAGNDHKAAKGGQQTQNQKNPVALPGKIL